MKNSHKQVLEIFRKDVFLKKTIREISILLNKSYPGIYHTIKELHSANMLNLTKIGSSILCSLKLTNEAIAALSYLDYTESFQKDIPNIRKILDFEEFQDDIILVTGSYTKNKQTEDSDIDLVIITKENPYNKQKFLENSTSLFLPKMHVIVFAYSDFLLMLTEKDPNFGKEAFNSRFIYKNAERYYGLIKKAVNNGLRAETLPDEG